MPATKKKAPAAKRTQSKQTKSKTGVSRLLPKKGFQVWSATLIVVLVAAIGYSVVRYSQASSNSTMQCYALHTKADPNPTNKCGSAEWVSGGTGDLITLSDWPTYSGFTGMYTSGDQICVDIFHEQAPRVIQGGSGTQTDTKSNGSSGTQYAPTPSDQVSVALTLKSNPATRKVLNVKRYGQGDSWAGGACVTLVRADYDYRNAIDTPGGIQVKVLQGPIKKLGVRVIPGPNRVEFPPLEIFETEDR